MVTIPIGTIINKDRTITDPVVYPVAAATSLPAGALVYEDGANGIKIVPDDSISAAKIFVNPFLADNSIGVLGDLKVSLYKTNTRAVVKGQGAIPHDSHFAASASVPGSIAAITEADVNFNAKNLGYYRSHVDEIAGKETPFPSDAVDAETDLVVDFT